MPQSASDRARLAGGRAATKISARVCGFAVCGLALLLAGSAAAQSAADAAAAWGLLGIWAVECNKPADRSNSYLSYVRKGGDTRDEHAVLSAKILSASRLEIVLDFKSFSQVRTIILQKEGEGRLRAVLNRDATGSYSIKDGKFISNGQLSPVQKRCAAPTK